MTPADGLYFFLMMQTAGFVVGLVYSFLFDWVGWERHR